MVLISGFLILLGSLITGFLTSLLFFKYVSPKEKKELKAERDRLLKEVEKLLKKENFLEVIGTFDQIASISDKMGDIGVSDEFRDRANTLRRKVGQEVKSDLTSSQAEIALFIQQLIKGPYGVTEDAEILEAMPSPAVSVAEQKSLIAEGEEILARLKRVKGEAPEEVSATPVGPSTPILSPPIPSIAAPSRPPMSPPKTAPPPMSPPIPSIAAPPPPKAPPPMIFPTTETHPVPSPEANSAGISSTKPIATPISIMAQPPPVDGSELFEELEEPQVQTLETFIGSESEDKNGAKKKKPDKKDEKSEIIARLDQELPYLPEKMKKNIIKELLKRPEGKLRETWFKVYVHKNKQYAEKSD